MTGKGFLWLCFWDRVTNDTIGLVTSSAKSSGFGGDGALGGTTVSVSFGSLRRGGDSSLFGGDATVLVVAVSDHVAALASG